MALTIPFLTFPDTNIRTGMKVDGVNYIPNPSSYNVSMSDLDTNSNRSSNGTLMRSRIRSNVYQIECSWDRLSNTQLSRLLGAVQAEKFQVSFRDPLNTLSLYTTAYFYADANKQAQLIVCEDDSTDFWSISLTFIQY